jgi:hypothetical protein
LRTSTGYWPRSSEASFLKGEHLARKRRGVMTTKSLVKLQKA